MIESVTMMFHSVLFLYCLQSDFKVLGKSEYNWNFKNICLLNFFLLLEWRHLTHVISKWTINLSYYWDKFIHNINYPIFY